MSTSTLRRLGGAATMSLALALVAAPATASAQDSGAIAVTRSSEATPFGYGPESLTVDVGATVTWSNPRFHTTGAAEDHPTACRPGRSVGSCPWTTKALPPGGSFSITFPAEGTFSYYCAVHPYMEGTVTVGDGDPTAPAPTEEPEPTSSPKPSATPEPEPTNSARPSPEPTAATTAAASPDSTTSEDAATDEPSAPPTSDAAPEATTPGPSDSSESDDPGGNDSGTDGDAAAQEAANGADDGGGATRPLLIVVALGLLSVAAWRVSSTMRAQ